MGGSRYPARVGTGAHSDSEPGEAQSTTVLHLWITIRPTRQTPKSANRYKQITRMPAYRADVTACDLADCSE